MAARFLLFVFALLLLSPLKAQTVTVDDMQALSFNDPSGQTLPYRLWVPANYNPAQEYPLVLFLHGAGERGTDNRSQLSVWPSPLTFIQPDVSAANPCFFVAPQCPTTGQWMDVPFNQGSYSTAQTPISQSLNSTLNLLSSLESQYNIDASRLYVTGLSMGGYGSFDLLARQPGRFAAAVPICGGGDPSQAGAMTNTGIWAFHAADDGAVPVSGSRDMHQAIQTAGGQKMIYTEYASGGHLIWDRAYSTPGLRDWVFSQQIVVAPEPGALPLLLGGLLLLPLRLRRR